MVFKAFLWPLASVLLTLSLSVGQTSENLELFWNLYSAVVRGSRILHDITEGAGAVSKAIRAIDSFLDVSPEDKTTETTKEGELVIADNQVASSLLDESDAPTVFNGCGALGFHIRDEQLPVGKMTDCCATHDKCYAASCKVNKKECDSKLRSCLFSMCDARTLDKTLQKTCISAAKLLFSGTMALSFQQYKDAQSRQDCHFQQYTCTLAGFIRPKDMNMIFLVMRARSSGNGANGIHVREH